MHVLRALKIFQNLHLNAKLIQIHIHCNNTKKIIIITILSNYNISNSDLYQVFK